MPGNENNQQPVEQLQPAIQGELGPDAQMAAYNKIMSGAFGEDIKLKLATTAAEGEFGGVLKTNAYTRLKSGEFGEELMVKALQLGGEGAFGDEERAVAFNTAMTYPFKNPLSKIKGIQQAVDGNYGSNMGRTAIAAGFAGTYGDELKGQLEGLYNAPRASERTYHPEVTETLRLMNQQGSTYGQPGGGFVPSKGYARGGLVTGKSSRPVGGTDSLDLPETLSALLPVGVDSSAYAPVPTGTVAANQNAAAMDFRQQPTYAQGGQVGPGGAPMPPSGAPAGLAPQGQQGSPMDPKMLEMQLQKFTRENPQQVEQIKQAVLEAMQTGELTQEDLNMAVQLATVALQNPDAYPQVRQFAIQQGLADESELSMEYDQGLIFVLLLAAKAVQSETAGAAPGGNFSQGGEINKGTGPTSDDVSIRVSKGEFVIPADVVKAKGTDFFEKMINPKGGAGTA